LILRNDYEVSDGSWHGGIDLVFPSPAMKTDIGTTIDMLLFDAAIQFDENDHRRIFLESTCATHPDRLARLTKLVGYHDESESNFAVLIDARDAMLAEIALDFCLNPGNGTIRR
jgi:hypothetical protein